jgi:hypothetical protein
LTDGVAEPARSLYDVRVLSVEPEEQAREAVTTFVRGAVEWILGGIPGGQRVRVEIVDVDTGEGLLSFMEAPDNAELLRRKIASDLDRLDAATFAAEWGLTSD